MPFVPPTSSYCSKAEPDHLILGMSGQPIELDPEAIGDRIRTLREAAGISQERLARDIDAKSGSDVSRWERGEVTPRAKPLARLADRFGCSIDYILTGKSAPRSNGQESEALRRFLATTLGKTARERGWARLLQAMNPPPGLEQETFRHAVYGLMDKEGEQKKPT